MQYSLADVLMLTYVRSHIEFGMPMLTQFSVLSVSKK